MNRENKGGHKGRCGEMSKAFWMEQCVELVFMAGGNEAAAETSQSQSR